MGLDRADREHEPVGDRRVREARLSQADELGLAGGEPDRELVETVDLAVARRPDPGTCRSRALAAARRAESWRPASTKAEAACVAAFMA